jgi:hypothetical protein
MRRQYIDQLRRSLLFGVFSGILLAYVHASELYARKKQLPWRMDTEHTPKAASESPLIFSGKAARRLRLLQLPGIPQAAASVPRHVRFEQGGSLPAALLPEPVPISDDCTSGPWQQTRDVLSEVAVSLDTMQALKVRPGRDAQHTPLPLSLLCLQTTS